jgi:Glycosyltransferase sugar-binding region containing DXD motif
VHYAHRADVFRLEKLIAVGGIYLDCDVFVHRDFDDLLDNSVVLGQEGEAETVGLCNAVILAEEGAPFLRRWYSQYKSFRSKGHDPFWNEHSVKLPRKLAEIHGDELTILGPRAFFWPMADGEGLERIFASNELIPSVGVYANHLWESHAWSPYLCDLTPARVRLVDSNFHRWIRPLIADLPDDFGAPPRVSSVINRITTDQLLERKRGSRRIDKRIVSVLRNRHPLIGRAIRSRHKYVDRGLGVIAAWAAKTSSSWVNPIIHLHRRRTFQAIYRQDLWGGNAITPFFSGFGSRGEHAKLYVEAMVPLLRQHASESSKEFVIVDLGCGDFEIGSQLVKSLCGVRYIGCDIVPELIEYNQYRYGTPLYGKGNIEFRTVDIVRDRFPDGDLCLVRQVLQHLSNAEISAILPKLSKYRHVYISEGQPLIRQGFPNPDKPVGQGVRYDWSTGRGRGVELDLPPWNLPLQEIVRTTSPEDIKGFICTYRILSFNPAPANTHAAMEESGDRVLDLTRGSSNYVSSNYVSTDHLYPQSRLAK